MKINEILTEQQGVAEARYFKTSYGWAGGSKPSGGTYKHPEQIRADKEAKKKAKEKEKNKPQGVVEGFSNDMSTKDMIAYLKQHHDKNLHPDYLNHLTSTNSKFVLKNIPLNSIRTELAGLDRAKVEQYKQMDFSKAPPIVVGSDGNILDGYHRATVAKALGIPTIKAYVGIKGQQGVAEGVNVKQIKKDLDSGMSVDAVIGKHANRRTTNTDEIRRVIQQHAWEKRKNKTKEQGVAEGSEQLWIVSFTDGEDIIKVRASSQQEAIFRATQIAKSKGNPYPSVDWAKPKEQGVAEGFTADDTNDYYADYYTDLLSQIRNMSWTDRATTKANVKRDLDSGRIKLPDLKLEIRNLDREIRAKQGVSEGQKR